MKIRQRLLDSEAVEAFHQSLHGGKLPIWWEGQYEQNPCDEERATGIEHLQMLLAPTASDAAMSDLLCRIDTLPFG